MSAWQPIETAPMDGTLILSASRHQKVDEPQVLAVIAWSTRDREWFCPDGADRPTWPWRPTHWQPLPDPPAPSPPA